jgi:hypothetical protein
MPRARLTRKVAPRACGRGGGSANGAQTVLRGEEDGRLLGAELGGGTLLTRRAADERERPTARRARIERAVHAVVTMERPRDRAGREGLAQDTPAGEELHFVDGGGVERVNHADAQIAVALEAERHDPMLDGDVGGQPRDHVVTEVAEALQIRARDARLCAGVLAHPLLIDEAMKEELFEPGATAALRGLCGPLDLLTRNQVLPNEEFFEL